MLYNNHLRITAVWLGLLAALILTDQITKSIFASRDFFVGPVHIYLQKNFALPFGFDFGNITNAILISLALGYFVWYSLVVQHRGSRIAKISLLFILSGALGNIADRLVLGFVRDFIDLGLGFSFNLADAFVFVGLLGLLSEMFFDSTK